MGFAAHTHFVTVGQAIGDPGCEVPTCGLECITTAQPIVLEHWPATRRIIHDAPTTVWSHGAGLPPGFGQRAAIYVPQRAHAGNKSSVRSAGESDTRRRGDRALLVHERGTPELGSGVVDTSFAWSVEPRRRKALERRSVKTWTTRSAKDYLLLDDRVYSLVV
jgi:hypothetical protein